MELEILFSHFYARKDPLFHEAILMLGKHARIIIDSGAYSNHMQSPDKPVELADYTEACRKYYKAGAWQCIALDVIKNPPKSRENLERMVDAGVIPMPVFVYPEEYDYLHRLLEINKHICIAGGMDASRQFMIQRISRVYKESGGAAKLHGLAFVKWPIWLDAPLYSVDSSSWTGGLQYGAVHLFRGPTGFRVLGGVDDRNPVVLQLMRQCKIGADQVANRNMLYKAGSAVSFLTTYAHLRAQEYTRKMDKHYFLAVAARLNLATVIAVMNGMSETGFDFPLARDVFASLKEKETWLRNLPAALKVIQRKRSSPKSAL